MGEKFFQEKCSPVCSNPLLLCCRFRGEGYQEGYEEGSGLGIIEGRQHGTVYGAKIGSEVSGRPHAAVNPAHGPFRAYFDDQSDQASTSGLLQWP